MALSLRVYNVLEEQKNLVLALDNPEVLTVAKEIAFYRAMLFAARMDPMDDQELQDEICSHFNAKLTAKTAIYMYLINDLM